MERKLLKSQQWFSRILFAGKVNISRRTHLWNLASSISFSFQSALFLLIATRVSGEEAAGGFILLFTIAQMLNSVGNYSIRDFQVSDLHAEYSFACYYTTRILTCSLMMLIALGYCLWNHLSPAAAIVMLSLTGYRFIEGMEDVTHGAVQRAGRFDLSSICMTLRIVLSSLVFCLVYIFTANQVLAALALFFSSLLVYFFTIAVLRAAFPDFRPGWETPCVGRLLVACFPLFIGAFLYSYLNNAPKYAIGALLPGDQQTIYNILSMPAFIISMLSMLIYKPLIVRMSELWDQRDRKGFIRQILLQIAIIAALTLFVVLGGWLIGRRLLELIYGVDLLPWQGLLTLLLVCGGLTALVSYFYTLLTITRHQLMILIGYGLSFLIQLFTTRSLVSAYGVLGAGYAYAMIMIIMILFFLGSLIICIHSDRPGSGPQERSAK